MDTLLVAAQEAAVVQEETIILRMVLTELVVERQMEVVELHLQDNPQ
tara:strand:- start:2 stop:142 length:141 start_codon:yes stop_codon:yes gene_type:complete